VFLKEYLFWSASRLPDVKKPGSFAANCLMARRLAERGVRFIQLYMRGWDQHNNLPKELRDHSDNPVVRQFFNRQPSVSADDMTRPAGIGA